MIRRFSFMSVFLPGCPYFAHTWRTADRPAPVSHSIIPPSAYAALRLSVDGIVALEPQTVLAKVEVALRVAGDPLGVAVAPGVVAAAGVAVGRFAAHRGTESAGSD